MKQPHSHEAELAVLGAALTNNDALDLSMLELETDSFYATPNQLIFRAIKKIHNSGETPDEILVKEILERKGYLKQVGGAEYIAKVLESGVNAFNVHNHIKILKDKALMRRLIATITSVLHKTDSALTAKQALAEAEKLIFGLSNETQSGDLEPLTSILDTSLQELVDILEGNIDKKSVTSSLGDLDDITGGFQRSDLIILAARPSVGKTALALNFGVHAAVDTNTPVLFFSLEMSKRQVAARILSMHGGVSSEGLRSGDLNRGEINHIAEVAEGLRNAPIAVDDTANISVADMRAKAKKWIVSQPEKYGIIIVDYMQLMRGDGDAQTREREVAMISSGLKALARELDIPVVALSQLSRKTEEHKMPRMCDLRESGAIEQDADLVMLLHRERDKDTGALSNKGALNLAKHRNGATGVIGLNYNPSRMLFEQELNLGLM